MLIFIFVNITETPSTPDTVILVEATTETLVTPQVSVAFSKTHLKHMEDEINEIRSKLKELAEMPGNMGLLDAARDKKPVVDMYQILSLSKRVQAAEEGMEKLASMMEDWAKNTQNVQCKYNFNSKYVEIIYLTLQACTTYIIVVDFDPGVKENEEGGTILTGKSSGMGAGSLLGRLTNIEKAVGNIYFTFEVSFYFF